MAKFDLSNVQAVVFAGGYGNRMTNLTEQIEKPLLPIANLPMFWYPLNILARNSVKDVILIIKEQCYNIVRTALNDGSLPLLSNLNIEFVALGSDVDADVEEWGTADVLRHIHNKILPNRDLLLLSGDVVSDITLQEMFNYHHKNSAFLTCLLWDSPLNGPIPGPKDRDFLAIVPETGQLLFLAEEDDLEGEEDFDTKLFLKFPKVLLTSKYKDCHLYFVNSNVIELLKHDEKRNYTSIKTDLIPYLLKLQYQRKKNKLAECFNNADIEYRCFAYRASIQDCTLLAQCNTTAAYFEANKAVQRILKTLSPSLSESQQNTQNFKAQKINVFESLISGTNTGIGEKTVIKKSVIGPNCTLGSNVKVDNSLLISGVCIKNGAVIKNSIIFPNCKIGEKGELIMCIVGADQIINSTDKIANAVIRTEKEMDLEE